MGVVRGTTRATEKGKKQDGKSRLTTMNVTYLQHAGGMYAFARVNCLVYLFLGCFFFFLTPTA
jgi:hypothetical protein